MSGSQSAELSGRFIARAGEALGRAHTLLLQPTPQNLDIACSALAVAISQVTEVQTILTPAPCRDLTAAVAVLRKEVDLISLLLEHAASYHVNLMQCMIEASASHAPQGRCMAPVRRLSLKA